MPYRSPKFFLTILLFISMPAFAQLTLSRRMPNESNNLSYSFSKTIAHKVISNHGHIVAAGYSDGSIDLWKSDGTFLQTIANCYPENDYNERALYINEEDNLLAWGYQSSKGWDDPAPEHFFCWKKMNGTDTSTLKIQLPDDPFSIDYDPISKKWLIGTGSYSLPGKLSKPGIYWVDAGLNKILKEWHVSDNLNMQVKFAPGAQWFMAMGNESYSKDTLQPVYLFSGKDYSKLEKNNSFKGSSPGFCALPNGAFVVWLNFSPVIWHVNPNGERKRIELSEYQYIEQLFYDEERKACTGLFRKSDNNEYEWVQFDEEGQVLNKKAFRTTASINQAVYYRQQAIGIAAADSLLTVINFILPAPKPKLFLQLQTGHSQSVDEVVMHPSLPLAASISRGEGKIKIWDLQTGFQLDDIKAGYAEDVQFVPPANQLAWREFNKIIFYDLKSRTVSNELNKDILSDPVTAFAVSTDAKSVEIFYNGKHQVMNTEDGTIRKEIKSGIHVTRFILLNKEGDKLFYGYNEKADTIGYMSASGKLLAARSFPEIRRWWLNKNKTAVALLLSKNGRLHNTKLLLLELPSLKTKQEITLDYSETVAPDASFSKLVTAYNDTMYIRPITDKTRGQAYYQKDEYFSSLDPLDWDISGQYVIRIDNVNNNLRLFHNYWRKLGEDIQMPVLLQPDISSKQLLVGTETGLWSLPLNYLKKASLLDTQARFISSNNFFIAAKEKNIVYHASFFGKEYGKTFAVFSATAKKEAVSNLSLENQVYHPTINWLAGTTRNGYIHLLKPDSNFQFLQQDSLPGMRPVFAAQQPYLAYLDNDSTTIVVYNFETKLVVDTFRLRSKEFYPTLGRGFCFIENDQKLIWSRGAGGTIYTLKKHEATLPFYLTHDIVSLQNAGHHNFYAGDNTGTIFYINSNDGKNIQSFYGHTEAITSLALYENNLYSAAQDGTIKIWDTDSARLKLTMVLDKEGNVLMIDDETNYYASSRRDPKAMAFVYKGKVLPFEQFDLFANRPDDVLMKTGMANEEYISAVKEAVEKRIRRSGKEPTIFDVSLPEIFIPGLNELPLIVKKRVLNIPVTVSDSTGLVKALHISVNGVPLYGRRGWVLAKPSKKYTTTISIPLSTGTNRVEIMAENDKQVQSAKEVFQLEYEPEVKMVSKIYYIGVGVSRYAEADRNLEYAAKDIRDMATAFKKQFPDALIDTLTNEQATRENLLKLKSLLMKTNIDDKVIVSFSGHGLLDKQKDFYFGTHNINFKAPQKEGWSFADMQWLLDSIPARNKLLLVDACHSGEVDKDEPVAAVKNDSLVTKGARSSIVEDESVIGLQNSFALMQELFSDLENSNGTIMITAAGGRQFALEGKQWNNGVFTYSLLRGLVELKADNNFDGIVTVSELRQYLLSEVQRLTDGRQQPTTRMENLVNDWNIWQ